MQDMFLSSAIDKHYALYHSLEHEVLSLSEIGDRCYSIIKDLAKYLTCEGKDVVQLAKVSMANKISELPWKPSIEGWACELLDIFVRTEKKYVGADYNMVAVHNMVLLVNKVWVVLTTQGLGELIDWLTVQTCSFISLGYPTHYPSCVPLLTLPRYVQDHSSAAMVRLYCERLAKVLARNWCEMLRDYSSDQFESPSDLGVYVSNILLGITNFMLLEKSFLHVAVTPKQLPVQLRLLEKVAEVPAEWLEDVWLFYRAVPAVVSVEDVRKALYAMLNILTTKICDDTLEKLLSTTDCDGFNIVYKALSELA